MKRLKLHKKPLNYLPLHGEINKKGNFMTNKKLILIAIIVLLMASCFAMFPSLFGGFLNWDDPAYITKNADIFNLSFSNIKKIFSSFYCGTYVPLTVLSFMIEFYFVKMNPFLFHLDNLILHLLNSLLIFWFIYLLFQSTQKDDCNRQKTSIVIAFIVSLFFGVHPLHVESVAWLTERKDTLYAFFYLASLIAYLKHLNSKSKIKSLKLLIFAFLLFCCSLLSKSMAVTLPVIFLLIDFLLCRKITLKSVLIKIPFLGAAVAIGLTAVLGQTDGRSFNALSLFERLTAISHHFMFYIKMTILPLNISPIYPLEINPLSSYISTILFLFLLVIVIFSLKYTRKIFFAFLFYIISILPTMTETGAARVADRFYYIPSIGIFLLITLSTIFLYKKYNFIKRYVLTFLVIIVICFTYISNKYCHVWKNSLTLWEHGLSIYPKSIAGRENYASALVDIGQFQLAIENFKKVIEIQPWGAKSFYNIGIAYSRIGKFHEAITNLSIAIQMHPEKIKDVLNERAIALTSLNLFELAEQDYSASLKLNPNDQQTLYNRGMLYLNNRKFNKAIKDFSEILIISPDFTAALICRGIAYSSINQFILAEEDYSDALNLVPNTPSVLYNRAMLYKKTRKYDKAIDDFTALLKVNPNNGKAYYERGIIFRDIKNEVIRAEADLQMARLLSKKPR